MGRDVFETEMSAHCILLEHCSGKEGSDAVHVCRPWLAIERPGFACGRVEVCASAPADNLVAEIIS